MAAQQSFASPERCALKIIYTFTLLKSSILTGRLSLVLRDQFGSSWREKLPTSSLKIENFQALPADTKSPVNSKAVGCAESRMSHTPDIMPKSNEKARTIDAGIIKGEVVYSSKSN